MDNNKYSQLQQIASGEFGGIEKIIKFVKDGHKLDSFALKALFNRLSEEGYSAEELLEIYFVLDDLAEKGTLTNEAIEALKNEKITGDIEDKK